MPSDTPTTPPMTPDEAKRRLVPSYATDSLPVSYFPTLTQEDRIAIHRVVESQQAEIERLRETLGQYADKAKWRYRYSDSEFRLVWIGKEHGYELAQRTLQLTPPAAQEG